MCVHACIRTKEAHIIQCVILMNSYICPICYVCLWHKFYVWLKHVKLFTHQYVQQGENSQKYIRVKTPTSFSPSQITLVDIQISSVWIV